MMRKKTKSAQVIKNSNKWCPDKEAKSARQNAQQRDTKSASAKKLSQYDRKIEKYQTRRIKKKS